MFTSDIVCENVLFQHLAYFFVQYRLHDFDASEVNSQYDLRQYWDQNAVFKTNVFLKGRWLEYQWLKWPSHNFIHIIFSAMS